MTQHLICTQFLLFENKVKTSSYLQYWLFYSQNSRVSSEYIPLNYMRCSQHVSLAQFKQAQAFLAAIYMLHIAFFPQDSAWHIALLHFSSLRTLHHR